MADTTTHTEVVEAHRPAEPRHRGQRPAQRSSNPPRVRAEHSREQGAAYFTQLAAWGYILGEVEQIGTTATDDSEDNNRGRPLRRRRGLTVP